MKNTERLWPLLLWVTTVRIASNSAAVRDPYLYDSSVAEAADNTIQYITYIYL